MGGQACTHHIHMRPLILVMRLVVMQACVVYKSALSAKLPLKPAWGRRLGLGSGSGREREGVKGEGVMH